MNFKIYVADLAEYNNGNLVGKWLDFNNYSDSSEVEEEIQNMLNKNGNEEFAIHDYENDLNLEINEYDNVDELFDIYELCDDDENLVKAIIEIHGSEELVNIGNYYLLYDIDDEYDVGEYYAEFLELCETTERYFNYKSFGRDILMDGGSWLTDFGLLCEQ